MVPSEPTKPEQPQEPSEPTDPEQPEIPFDPSGSDWQFTPEQGSTSGYPSITLPQSGFSGYTGTYPQIEEVPEVEIYDLAEITVAAVTGQNTMTFEITVDELDLRQITLGQTAAATVNLPSHCRLHGRRICSPE